MATFLKPEITCERQLKNWEKCASRHPGYIFLETKIRNKTKNPFLLENESLTYGLVYFEKELDSGATYRILKI